MGVHRRLATTFLLLGALLGVSACATGPSLTVDEIQAVRDGRQSAIIMSYREYAGMYGAYIQFTNMWTGQVYQVEMHGGTNIVNAGPDMVAVMPGRYRVSGGTLYTSDGTGTMPMLGRWFQPFEVGAGEVVDIGTLRIDDVNVKAVPGVGEQILNALITFNPNRTDTYLIYSVDYSDAERVEAMLASKYPTLDVVPVRRPLIARIDRAAFEAAIVEAYALDAEGRPPTVEEAQRRVAVTLDRVVR